MRSVVKKWGNSAAVRLSSSVMTEAQLQLDQPVEVRAENGRVIIAPILPAEYELATLLAGITPDNLHEALDWGQPEGREIL